MNAELADFAVPILFWVIALGWGIKTCVDAGSWKPLKEGFKIFVGLFLLPTLLLAGVWYLNEYLDGNLGTIVLGILGLGFLWLCIMAGWEKLTYKESDHES